MTRWTTTKWLGVTALVTATILISLPGYAAETAHQKAVYQEMRKHPQVGAASWYKPGPNLKTTASGEPYRADRLTAAHIDLPLGSKVKVTNLENGKSVDVKVNDRGPMVPGRIIDLSPKAAEKLDMKKSGIAEVVIKPIAPPPAPVPRVTQTAASTTSGGSQ